MNIYSVSDKSSQQVFFTCAASPQDAKAAFEAKIPEMYKEDLNLDNVIAHLGGVLHVWPTIHDDIRMESY